MNGRRGGKDLARLIERSAELKRDLVDFACSPRLERSLAAAMGGGRPPTWARTRSGAAQRRIRVRSPRAHPPGARRLAGLRDDVELPQVRRGWIAKVALELATKRPRLVFRNPEKVEQGWRQMREDRAGFVAFFGADELIFQPGETEERLNAYYRHRQEAALARKPAQPRPPNLPGVDVPAFVLPPGLADAGTIGIIFDDVDGLNFYPEYGMLRDLFGNPRLAADKRYADALRGYLRSETIAPLPLQRLAAAYPDTVDAVFRKILRQRDFTWAEHGEALMRRRKAWYYRREPVRASRWSALGCSSSPSAVVGKGGAADGAEGIWG